jgi:hypothetical protein
MTHHSTTLDESGYKVDQEVEQRRSVLSAEPIRFRFLGKLSAFLHGFSHRSQ